MRPGGLVRNQGLAAVRVGWHYLLAPGGLFDRLEDVPRGLDFLFSRNRLNVAISRAQCLAYLVCSQRLLDANCKTVEQMRLANALCRLVETA